ncbi:hypothetical protein [uncultured Parasutterella sp.]|uniref:hypothetical protein n=2 Tax=uncultured Parasutterella sp. TaxID=1263098 RepID=UPI0025964224|nr:hypothetical protein [uncultured Parasutterella sp.]
MIQDYFSLSRKSDTYYLLRIINKVDFAEEVVWACDYEIHTPQDLDQIADRIISYLLNGFDSLSNWHGDKEGFHEPIQHFGFESVIQTEDIVPALIRNDADADPFVKKVLGLVRDRKSELEGKELMTKAGLLYHALEDSSLCPPKDPQADISIPLKLIFERDLTSVSALLQNYV